MVLQKQFACKHYQSISYVIVICQLIKHDLLGDAAQEMKMRELINCETKLFHYQTINDDLIMQKLIYIGDDNLPRL